MRIPEVILTLYADDPGKEREEIYCQTIDFTKMAFIGDDLTKMVPNNLPLVILRLPQPSTGRPEYYTVDSSFIKLMAKDFLKFSLTAEIVQKRVKESVDVPHKGLVERIEQLYKK